LNGLAFAGLFGGALLYVLHGKPLADSLFNEGDTALTAGFHNWRVYLTLLALVLFFASMRRVRWPDLWRAAVAAPITALGPLGIQLQSTSPSALIFVLHVYLCVVALFIVCIEPIFSRSFEPAFWQRFFAASIKSVSYSFTLSSALLAVLQYVSKGLRESIPGYLTSLAYPVGAVVLSLALVAFWELAPAWHKYLESFNQGGVLKPLTDGPSDDQCSESSGDTKLNS
jgi:hypothetical protein